MFAEAKRWQASFGWRYQKSDKHFRGSNEEENRQAEHSEVINTINLLDFTMTYTVDERWSLTFGVPYLMAERSSPIRDSNGVTIGRSISQARSLGDVVFGARRWMLAPETHPDTNWQLGFGLKFPTGPDNVNDRRTRYENDQYVTRIETVDQSIQPGDGGFGFVVDLGWFLRLAQGKCSLYFAGTYLFNPQGTNGVYTFRNRESEWIMSIADQYLARVGASFPVSKSRRLSASIGARIEGVPSEDVFGPSNGFRRPGYAVSVEPGLTYVRGNNEFSVFVPIAVYRNRIRSVPDKMDGTHGDAAFADWLLLLGYSRRFGHPGPAAETGTAPPTCTPGGV